MSDNQKYYYLKFKSNYFEQDHIKVIESMKNGYEYSLIILKLYLKSLKWDGRLMINERIPYMSDKIELLTGVLGHDPANVMHTINLSKELGVIDIIESGEMFMSDIQSFIGKSSTEADRIRKYREKLDNFQVTDDMYKCTPELELELELEKEIDIELHAPQAEAHFPLSLKAHSDTKQTVSDTVQPEQLSNTSPPSVAHPPQKATRATHSHVGDTLEPHVGNEPDQHEKWFKSVPIIISNGTYWDIPEYVASQILCTYPDIDLQYELKKMALWATGNYSKRKTAKGMPRFVTSWINRAAEDAPKQEKRLTTTEAFKLWSAGTPDERTSMLIKAHKIWEGQDYSEFKMRYEAK